MRGVIDGNDVLPTVQGQRGGCSRTVTCLTGGCLSHRETGLALESDGPFTKKERLSCGEPEN